MKRLVQKNLFDIAGISLNTSIKKAVKKIKRKSNRKAKEIIRQAQPNLLDYVAIQNEDRYRNLASVHVMYDDLVDKITDALVNGREDGESITVYKKRMEALEKKIFKVNNLRTISCFAADLTSRLMLNDTELYQKLIVSASAVLLFDDEKVLCEDELFNIFTSPKLTYQTLKDADKLYDEMSVMQTMDQESWTEIKVEDKHMALEVGHKIAEALHEKWVA